ncbi:AraC-type DNA-binding protein [Gracilibacillus ureilyticus]|uniref:AraC-type DNA-binding protein n=1 Tax=Gracilibacillus ureilyticus TaxID=531814 RepID=A0A1H9PPG9_9BACI|nr:helix-turn-helix domain-containing protein [Gracilibacillus ureilyticus]SER49960.1 AraC-type DNA-binding protein [Gracilibacillus ureilyticus]
MEQMFSVKYRVSDDPEHEELHSHDAYEIYMFHRGNCRYLINREIYDLLPGDILLMDGLALHKPNIPEDSEYIRSHLHFSPETVEEILRTMKATKLLNVFQVCHHYLIRTKSNASLLDVENIFKMMDQVMRATDISEIEKEWEMKLLTGQLLVKVNHLLHDTLAFDKKDKSGKAIHAEEIATYIQKHSQHRLSISEIAVALNLNKSYISHVFKEMTGFTVMEYVMACRMKQAKYLLEAEEKMAIQQIAFKCGFENASHFSRYFKEKEGVSPKEFRKKRLELFKKD